MKLQFLLAEQALQAKATMAAAAMVSLADIWVVVAAEPVQ
jgi:hypothetical protein